MSRAKTEGDDAMELQELLELLVILLASAAMLSYPDLTLDTMIMMLLPASGIILHEAAHKYIALKRGLRARIRLSIPGLATGFITAIRSGGAFIIAAPSYVDLEWEESPLKLLFEERPKEEGRSEENVGDEARLAVAGAAINGLISLIAFLTIIAIDLIWGFEEYLTSAIEAGNLIQFLLPALLLDTSIFNGMLALINLLPIPLPMLWPVPRIAFGDGFALTTALLELKRIDGLRKAPFHLVAVAIIGAALFILLNLGIVLNTLTESYEILL